MNGGNPLQVLIEEDLAGETATRFGNRRRFAALQRPGPLGPRAFSLARVERAEDRVVFDPPRLLGHKSLQLASAIGAAAPLGLLEARERSAKRRTLQTPDLFVRDRPRPSDFVEITLGDDRGVIAKRGPFGHVSKRGGTVLPVNRVDVQSQENF